MKLLVEGIPSAGRQLDLGLRDDWAAAAAAEAMDGPPSHLSGRVTVERAGQKGVVHVDLALEARTPSVCDRCGEPADRVSKPALRLLYAPEERGTEAYDGGEIELQAEDLDLGWYRDGELDLADVVREALALELPARTVCADSAACDKRTDQLLSATRPAGGPFAGLGAWKPRPGDD